MTPVDVTVVVCAYTTERLQLLDLALGSLAAQTVAPAEILLVTDHNAALHTYAELAWPDIVVIPSAGPPGLSGARNTGLDRARSPVIAFLDDDATADTLWIQSILAAFEQPTTIAVGGVAHPAWADARPRWLPPTFDWVVGCTHEGVPLQAESVRNVIGCNMAFRRTALEAVGGFDSTLGRGATGLDGAEETDVCIRLRAQFGPDAVRFDPALEVRHHVAAERTRPGYFLRRCTAEGRSKARLVAALGDPAVLSAEREHVRRTLPAAAGRALLTREGWQSGGPVQVGAILAGLAATTSGYLAERRRGQRPAAFTPVRLLDLDADGPVRAEPVGTDPMGRPYERAQVLVRRHGRPVGVEHIAAREGVFHLAELQDAVAELGTDGAGPIPRRGLHITVMIATRDRPSSLARCLASLRQVAYAPFDVVVVDNAISSPETLGVVTRARRQGLDVRYAREPIAGLSTAHNAGLKLLDAEPSYGDLIAFTDDDVEVDPGWLGALAETFAQHPDAGAVTGLIYPARLDHISQARAEGSGLGKGFVVRRFDLAAHRPADPLFPVAVGPCGSGANIAIRRAALREVGGFDLALGAGTPGTGGDDLAVLHDLLVRGHAVVYQPAAMVRHHHSSDPMALRRQAFGYGKGLGAYLTRCAVTDPEGVAVLVTAAPAGLRRLIGNERRVGNPGGVRRGHAVRHLAGLLAGPPAYLRGRRRSARISPHVGAGVAGTPGMGDGDLAGSSW